MNESTEQPRKRRKLLMTQQQYQMCMEHDIKKFLIEDERQALLESLNKNEWNHQGHIVTFKKAYPDIPDRTIEIHSLERDKSGRIRLVNRLGLTTPWFQTSEALVDAIDWDWMKLKTMLTI